MYIYFIYISHIIIENWLNYGYSFCIELSLVWVACFRRWCLGSVSTCVAPPLFCLAPNPCCLFSPSSQMPRRTLGPRSLNLSAITHRRSVWLCGITVWCLALTVHYDLIRSFLSSALTINSLLSILICSVVSFISFLHCLP